MATQIIDDIICPAVASIANHSPTSINNAGTMLLATGLRSNELEALTKASIFAVISPLPKHVDNKPYHTILDNGPGNIRPNISRKTSHENILEIHLIYRRRKVAQYHDP